MKTARSKDLYSQALRLMPGGVSSPVRSFKGVHGSPLFMQRASGAHIWDLDGNRYIDYIGSFGPMILGHSEPSTLRSIKKTLKKGVSFGASCPLELDLALLVQKCFPSIEKLRFVNSGTEAVMSAIRAARGFTKKKKVIKFDGCYHGHSDSLLVKAGSGAATLGVPDSAGVPEEFTSQTLVATFNNLKSVEGLVKEYSGDIAAIIIEPIVGNMGVILPRNNFLKKLRELCNREDILLIFDEVMTGFRVSLGGVQELYGVKPDLTTLGKIIGGGLPVGAYGGRSDIMSMIAPEGPVYQAGTLSGNPIAMSAGIATLKKLMRVGHKKLGETTQMLTQGLKEAAEQTGVKVVIERAGSMFTIFFFEGPITNADDVRKCDAQKFSKFFHLMLKQGISLPPSPFEACFVSTAHSKKDVRNTIDAARNAFALLIG